MKKALTRTKSEFTFRGHLSVLLLGGLMSQAVMAGSPPGAGGGFVRIDEEKKQTTVQVNRQNRCHPKNSPKHFFCRHLKHIY